MSPDTTQRRNYTAAEIRERDKKARDEAIAESKSYTDSMETQTRGWAMDGFYSKAQSDTRYYTKDQSDFIFQPKGNYQPAGDYATNAALGNYYTKSASDSRYLQSVPAQSWASITGKPTTYAGYGLPDTYSKTESDAKYLTQALGDARYLQTANAFTQTQADARYYQKADVYTKAEADAKYALLGTYQTQAQADARYNRLASDNTWTARNFMPNGTLAAPSMAFSGSPTTGFYAPANNGVAIGVGGAQAFHARHSGSAVQMGFYGVAPVSRPAITGLNILGLNLISSIVQAGVALGLWTDNRIL